MKILLIKPACTIYHADPTIPSATLPYGIAYLASFLAKKGQQVALIDALSEGIKTIQKYKHKTKIGLTDSQIRQKIKQFKPDVVGITSMFTAYSQDAHDLAKLVKKIDRQILVVMGGAHASINPHLTIKDPHVDIVVKGEGEHTLYEIIKALKQNKDYHHLAGTTTKKGKKIISNLPRKFIKNLDSLPFPAYHLLPMKVYFETAKKSPFIMHHQQMAIISSRGCPGNCSYCSIHAVWGSSWRGRSPQNVVDEMEFLIKNYAIKEFAFLDDSVSTSKQRLKNICRLIIKRKLNIKWTTPNGIAHWTLNKSLLRLMKASGCYRVTFGIESGNLKTRESIGWKKNFSLNQAKNLTKYANKIGLWTISTFILGFPNEDEKSIQDTIEYAIESDTDFAAFFLLMPFPGTKVYQVFKDQKLLNFDQLLDPTNIDNQLKRAQLGAALAQHGCQTTHFTQLELQDLLTQAYSRFWKARFISFLNPVRIIRKIHSPTDLKFLVRIGIVGIKLKLNQLKQHRFTAHMINSKKSSLPNPLLSNSLIMLVGANLGNGLNFISHILIARLLLPQNFGLFQSLVSLTALTGIIFTSLSLVIINQASQKRSKTYRLQPFFNFSFKLSLLLSFFLLALFPYLSFKLSIPNFGIYFIFLLILLTSFIPTILGSLLQAKLKFYQVSFLSITTGLIKLLFVWIFLNLNLQVSGALLAILTTTIISSLLTYLFVQKHITTRRRAPWRCTLPWKFIATTTITNLGLVSLISADVILARIFFSPSQSGYYAAAAALAKIIFFAISPIFTVTFPLFSTVHLGGAHLLKQASILISSLVLIIFAVLKTNPKSIITLVYGANYQSASTLLPLLSLTMLLYTLFYLNIQFLLARHHPATTKIASITAILQILLIIFHHPTPISIITNTIISLTLGLLLSLTKVSPLLKINK